MSYILRIVYSSKTNPEVMNFQLLTRKYLDPIKKHNVKLKYVKNIKVPFRLELLDLNGNIIYVTYDYRRIKFILRKTEF